MILSKKQINRYLRHIIIPEISGAGQKKITQLKIYLYSTTVKEASSLIYYLAASGIGCISCFFKDATGFESLYENIKDLNSDVLLVKLKNGSLKECTKSFFNDSSIIRIVISKYEDLESNLINFHMPHDSSNFIATIVATNIGWNGYLHTICNPNDLNELLAKPLPIDLTLSKNNYYDKEGNILSNSLLSALISVECIKLCLKIGTILDKPLFFNLSFMEFYKSENILFSLAITDFIENIKVHNNSPNNLEKTYNSSKLSDKKVLIVGAGGLGSPVALALSMLGIGTIGLVDYDKVEISNLNRQIFHTTSRIGMQKVTSAEIYLKNINPNVHIVTHNTKLTTNNALDIIKDYDVIVDGLDNFPARYLLNDFCFLLNKPLVDAAAARFHGLIMTILPNKGPCYRCVFPVIPEQNSVMSCSEVGVLGPVPGVMGFLEATEVVKLLLCIGEPLHHRTMYYDALDCDFDFVNTNKSPNCKLCGTSPTIKVICKESKPK